MVKKVIYGRKTCFDCKIVRGPGLPGDLGKRSSMRARACRRAGRPDTPKSRTVPLGPPFTKSIDAKKVIYGEKGHLWEKACTDCKIGRGLRLLFQVIYGGKGHLGSPQDRPCVQPIPGADLQGAFFNCEQLTTLDWFGPPACV
jgi:hypothetical protein